MASAVLSTNTSSSSPVKSFDVSQLPSLVQDGMSVKEELDKRRKTCRFIEEAGRILKLPRVAVSTAMVFFHRFYAKHSFSQHDRFEVAVASLVLAAKTEESPKKLNHVIDECYKLKMRGVQAGRMSSTPTPGSSSGGSPMSSTSGGGGASSLDPKGEEFLKLKERILLLERVLLHTIGFELSIDHPYKFLVEIIKKLVNGRKIEFITDSQESQTIQSKKMMNQMVQWAMNFANDSMQTTVCLQFEPEQIAVATVYLAAQFAKVRPSNQNVDWLDLLGNPDVETLASISLQVIELIAERKGSDQATFVKIRRDLDNLKNEKRPAAASSLSGPDVKRPRVGA